MQQQEEEEEEEDWPSQKVSIAIERTKWKKLQVEGGGGEGEREKEREPLCKGPTEKSWFMLKNLRIVRRSFQPKVQRPWGSSFSTENDHS